LIAMLREAGVEAYIALLNVGSGFDTEPDLPGLEAFDHTIVYIPGAAPDGEPIWIDSTAGFSRAGQIPAADQGHRALIARPGTYALERVPEQVGRIVETREVFLPEDGFGRVVETTQLLGPPEITFRAIYAAVEESALRQNLAEYARQIYGAEVLGETDMGAPRDFDRSFGISFEADEARFLVTAGGESAAFLVLTPILTELAIAARLYDQWRQGPAGPADGMSPEAEFVAVEAVVREWRYRIVPPPGYRLDQLPETRTDDLGAAVLSREFTETPDGVEGLIRLDVPRRFTGEEAAGLLSAMNTLPVVLTVSFRSAGQTHLDAGEIREALGAFRELAAPSSGAAWARPPARRPSARSRWSRTRRRRTRPSHSSCSTIWSDGSGRPARISPGPSGPSSAPSSWSRTTVKSGPIWRSCSNTPPWASGMAPVPTWTARSRSTGGRSGTCRKTLRSRAIWRAP
jgi:hypothetical protein